MSDTFPEGMDHAELLEHLVEDFLARYRRGENPSISHYAQRYPDLADEIQEVFPAMTMLEEMKGAASAQTRPKEVAAPKQLGDFEILREIGRGGMGIVYEARQISLQRRVAVKVLPQTRLGREQLERFRREAKAAGRLHHTHIVPVFGVGEQEGLHYYVMQFIAGQGVDQLVASASAATWASNGSTKSLPGRPPSAGPVPSTHLLGNRLTFSGESDSGQVIVNVPQLPIFATNEYYQRVASLMIAVCDALAHAHEHGIIHRDIKPANLLVDQSGHIWVTDFGLAKFVDQEKLTDTGDMAGTLRYSAPERFKGFSDHRSDIFGLGLTLYELCTLRPAYEGKDAATLLRKATEANFPAPRSHNTQLPRDLETILLKALAREPEARYASAAAMRDDLRLYLEDRPILARRTTWIEHLLRWCRRNPVPARLSAALLLVSIFGVAGITWKWREAEDALGKLQQSYGRETTQRERAEGNLEVALEAFDRIGGRLSLARSGLPMDLDSDDPPMVPILTQEAANLLQELVEFHERFVKANQNDPRLRRDTLKALQRSSALRLRMGHYEQAERALGQAAELAETNVEIAQIANDRGQVLRAFGKADEAHREHQSVIDLLQGATAEEEVFELARAHHFLAAVQARQKHLPQAQASEQAALALVESLRKCHPSKPAYRHLAAQIEQGLAQLLALNPQQLREAQKMRSQATLLLEALVKEFPKIPDYRAELAELLLNAPQIAGLRPTPETLRRGQQAVELATELTDTYPAMPDYQRLLARAKGQLGQTQLVLGKTEDAIRNLQAAVEIHRNLYKRYPNRAMVHLTAFYLAEALKAKNDLKGADLALREALKEGDRLPDRPMSNQSLAKHYRSKAEALQRLGKRDEALKYFQLAQKYATGS